MGYSQASVLPIARLASWVGVYGVSFLVVFVNVTLWFSIEFWREQKKRLKILRKLLYPLLFLSIIIFHFSRPVSVEKNKETTLVNISIVQGNIPQSEKWDPGVKSNIIQTYQKLSELVGTSKSDLIIWPEAAWPGIFNLDPEREEILKSVRPIQTPFLIGSPYEEMLPEFGRPGKIFNSAYLIGSNGETLGRYDKIRLVPFGEFVPLALFFNLFGLEKYAYSLGVGDFSAGNTYRVFELPKPKMPVRFSTLICFEDTFPELARKFVDQGAQFLIVITNDAWFGKSAAAYQHLQASIFRAIENGVPVVRAANTGVSAFILPNGEVVDRVKDEQGSDAWIAGGLTRPVTLAERKTIYRMFGYLSHFVCVLLVFGSYFGRQMLLPHLIHRFL